MKDYGNVERNGQAHSSAPDLWLVLDLLVQRWRWLVLGGCLAAGLFVLLGWRVIKPKFTATAQLLRYETPGEGDFYKTPISGDTFAALICSPDPLRRVGQQAEPPIPPEQLLKFIKVEPDPDSDVVRLYLASRQPQQAVQLLNAFATNAVLYARDWYAQRAQTVAKDYLQKEVTQMDQDISVLDQHFRNLALNPMLTNKLAQVGGALNALSTNLTTSPAYSMAIAREREKLDTAIGELNDLLLKYTELHPLVKAKQDQIRALESRLASAPTNQNLLKGLSAPVLPKSGETVFNPELDIIRTKLLSLEEGRVQLANRQREAQLYAQNPPGIVRVLAPATLQTVQTNHRRIKIGVVAVIGGLMGVGASLLLVLLVEFVDNRLKTRDDVRRVVRLPVLTTLGDLHEMGAEARSQWAFRTWTMLQGQLSPSANHGLVCGITSSSPGEGRSTWISLLAEAASLTGFRVLTIATRPSPTRVELDQDDEEAPAQLPLGARPTNGNSSPVTTALTTSVLSSPAKVTEQLTGPNSQPVVHIPLPGWVWNLERRVQWREAIDHWSKIENLVILVELPPASVPEAVLLGSNLPNVLWLTDSGRSQAGDTRTHLETLRHARCNLVGAVLNREMAPPLKKRFSRWLGCLAALAVWSSAGAWAQDNSAATNASLSIVSPAQRAAWQRHLTLGPGDVLNLALFGQPELARTEVAVGPDGRLSYLEAQDILATGLTIDELRAKFDQELGKYRRAPRTIITPVAFRSKKYTMLGSVVSKGVYTLDRPLTVVEAIARAHGVESGLIDRNLVDLADFQHSFLVRDGKRLPVNFDALFQGGDLSQNIAIEPGDYLYFASADVQEVYVVGEVRLPGAVTYKSEMTILEAITARGGYSERAFKARVLVVRGSLNHPQAIAVDTHAILDAKEPDFKLQPRDIIYVNSRPFVRVEELADLAATAFIQSIVSSWVGVGVVKPFRQ